MPAKVYATRLYTKHIPYGKCGSFQKYTSTVRFIKIVYADKTRVSIRGDLGQHYGFATTVSAAKRKANMIMLRADYKPTTDWMGV
jgi:hypothetical protein